MSPAEVRVETIEREGWPFHPYRSPGLHAILRLIVSIAPRGMLPCEVTLEIDDATALVRDRTGCFAINAIDALFVVERQPPAWRFLTWFGVFARRRGCCDRLLLETPDRQVARFVERAVETRLGLRDVPIRGELRIA